MFRVRSWEIDPDQPRIPLPPIGRFRHYRNLDRFEERLRRLLSEFRFASLAERLGLEGEEARRLDEDGRSDEGRAARSGAVGA